MLGAIIKSAAPKAEERISYGMPYYRYKGRLVYFRLSRAHIGLYVPTPVIEEHKSELKDYETAKATVRFPLEAKLPLALIKKLVKARVKKRTGKSIAFLADRDHQQTTASSVLTAFQPIEACQTMKTHGTSFISVVSTKFFMLGDVGTVTLA